MNKDKRPLTMFEQFEEFDRAKAKFKKEFQIEFEKTFVFRTIMRTLNWLSKKL